MQTWEQPEPFGASRTWACWHPLLQEYRAGSVYFIMRGRLGNGQSHLLPLEPGHVGILSVRNTEQVWCL
ncbi:hypothetical protein CesoFtcFv8_008838 [Champsocephalus esox]|uniref:Uncharacterized protein n=1 Tax=Champsocephalus esox TaxID=159716 RepID=A0AAN8H217_9TELE|nr:hypothetical protein CesoFtcFv8_008838 [Champsocephalus esox]